MLHEDDSMYAVTKEEFNAGRTESIDNGRNGWKSWGHYHTFKSRKDLNSEQHNIYQNQRPREPGLHPPLAED